MNPITPESCQAVGLCDDYPMSRVRELIGESMTPMDATYLPIPARDIQYQLFRQLPQSVVQRAMELTVTRCVTEHALGTAIDDWARKWLSGENRSLSAAREAAAWDTARAAARDAAVAAYTAADAAAAREAAAWDTARAAERQLQLEDLRQAITEAITVESAP